VRKGRTLQPASSGKGQTGQHRRQHGIQQHDFDEDRHGRFLDALEVKGQKSEVRRQKDNH
jgi:hypothetical protein